MSQNELPIVVGLGELLWDCFAESRLPGGAPANVAFHACQLGCRGIVCSRVGRDPLGDELLQFLAGQGLETAWVQRDESHPTSTVTVDTSEPLHPRFTIHENVAWDYLAFDRALEELAGRAAALCFGTLAQRSPVSREAIQRAIRAVRPGCLVVYDVNLRQHFYQREWVETSLRASRIAKLNEDETVELDKLLGFGAQDQLLFARALLEQYGLDAVCITRGPRGCLLVAPLEMAEESGAPIEVADTVGAGDAFTAALIMGRLRGWPLRSQAAFANAVGGLVASRPGAMPILGEQFGRLAAEYEKRGEGNREQR
jgi:fructokinase